MKSAPYRAQFMAYVLAMMADNIEHVISYWVVFQKFHSPALAGFAVLSHWLPFLLFSVAVGSLADRLDPRRIIQCGMLLFIVASAGWGFFFITDTLQMWHAMLLLVIHGCAGVLWQTPNQLLLYDIVGPANLPSAVRLNATARCLRALRSKRGDGSSPILERPSCSQFCGACRCSHSPRRAFTRWRSRCCLPPASSSCRSTRWRRRWCR